VKHKIMQLNCCLIVSMLKMKPLERQRQLERELIDTMDRNRPQWT